MYKIFLFIFLSFSLLLLPACNQTKETDPSIYEWQKYDITFDYSGTSPFSLDEGLGWKVHEYSEDLLVISPFEILPVDMDFIYTQIQMIPNTSVEAQIQILEDTKSYSYVEVQDETIYSDHEFTIVHIHSSITGLNDTNFYLTEINGNVLQYEAGINDSYLVMPILDSLEVLER